MTQYYAQHLAADRLQRVYALAPPRAQRYLEAEILHLLALVRAGDTVLELGCGHGRVAERIAAVARQVVGIDVAEASLALARERAGELGLGERLQYRQMDALALGFADGRFDLVACVQNGVCAFRVDAIALAREAWRVLAPGGLLVFSSYSDHFWPDRLDWFERQAEAGLLGALDREASRDGTIVCTDGFRSGRATPAQFGAIGAALGVPAVISEVDASSLWCLLRKPLSPASDGRSPV
ncbi:MAG: class I SAM-dependent methyltransferase [Burkholderiales bacterium]|nr:class I SAM-dependent methyltransferase [Burkholderiales bacterium]